MRPLTRWLPLALCLALIAGLSTEAFSSRHTGQMVTAWVRWLGPLLGGVSPDACNAVLRKLMHVVVYGTLALCWYRALARDDRRRASALRASSAAMAAFLLTLGVGGMDEAHQRFVPGRTGQATDVALDGIGAALALLCGRGGRRMALPVRTGVAWPERG